MKTNIEKILENADNINPKINAFLTIERENALKRASEIDGSSVDLPLRGVPIAIKANICTKNIETSCASRILENFRPPYNATVIEKLETAGAIVIGKTNMDEFAMGSSNENSAFGNVLNPHDLTRVPGGSSGGSAAAVAAGIVDVSLGSDTGGSIRQPAAFCGVVGVKPTYGRVSRYGLVAFGSSLDQIGAFGKTTKDVASVMQVISGRDERDSTTANIEVSDYLKEIEHDIKSIKIGIPRELFSEGLNAEVRNSVESAIDKYKKLGAEIVDVKLPNVKYCIAVYYIIATAEASSNLARFDGVRFGLRAENAPELKRMYMQTREEGFGAEVKRRIMLGTYVLSSGYYDAYYSKAQKVRTLLRQDFNRAFSGCDAILTPTTPTTAFKLGENSDDPLQMYLNDIYTASANLVGVPAISLPCGADSQNLPIGMQLTTNFWTESTLFRLAHNYEKSFPLDLKPQVYAG